jgi:hypothetical protein
MYQCAFGFIGLPETVRPKAIAAIDKLILDPDFPVSSWFLITLPVLQIVAQEPERQQTERVQLSDATWGSVLEALPAKRGSARAATVQTLLGSHPKEMTEQMKLELGGILRISLSDLPAEKQVSELRFDWDQIGSPSLLPTWRVLSSLIKGGSLAIGLLPAMKVFVTHAFMRGGNVHLDYPSRLAHPRLRRICCNLHRTSYRSCARLAARASASRLRTASKWPHPSAGTPVKPAANSVQPSLFRKLPSRSCCCKPPAFFFAHWVASSLSIPALIAEVSSNSTSIRAPTATMAWPSAHTVPKSPKPSQACHRSNPLPTPARPSLAATKAGKMQFRVSSRMGMVRPRVREATRNWYPTKRGPGRKARQWWRAGASPQRTGGRLAMDWRPERCGC